MGYGCPGRMVENGLYTTSTQYYSVSKSFLLPHTQYGVDNDDVVNPLAAIPASVVVFPVTILAAILIPARDEVCLTLPIPNDPAWSSSRSD